METNSDKNKNIPLLPIAIIIGGGMALYGVGRALNWWKDKPAKEWDKLKKKPWILFPDQFQGSRRQQNFDPCYNILYEDWNSPSLKFHLERLHNQLDAWFTDEITLLGYIKDAIKSQFDFARISHAYNYTYGDDFLSRLQYKIDAQWDDIALENLNEYLNALPVTNYADCECNSAKQQNDIYLGINYTYDLPNNNWKKARNNELKEMFCNRYTGQIPKRWRDHYKKNIG